MNLLGKLKWLLPIREQIVKMSRDALINFNVPAFPLILERDDN